MLFDESILGIPLTINWRWVVKVVADIKIIKMTVTIFVVASLEPKNVPESGAPKKEPPGPLLDTHPSLILGLDFG